MDVLGEKLAELADKLGVTVAELWPLMVQKVVVDWWVGAAMGVLLWLSLIIFGRVIYIGWKDKESWFWDRQMRNDFSKDWESGFALAALIGYGAYFMVVFIATIIHLSTVGTLFYPEVAALQQILNMVG